LKLHAIAPTISVMAVVPKPGEAWPIAGSTPSVTVAISSESATLARST
jgi:hypothetical protein